MRFEWFFCHHVESISAPTFPHLSVGLLHKIRPKIEITSMDIRRSDLFEIYPLSFPCFITNPIYQTDSKKLPLPPCSYIPLLPLFSSHPAISDRPGLRISNELVISTTTTSHRPQLTHHFFLSHHPNLTGAAIPPHLQQRHCHILTDPRAVWFIILSLSSMWPYIQDSIFPHRTVIFIIPVRTELWRRRASG